MSDGITDCERSAQAIMREAALRDVLKVIELYEITPDELDIMDCIDADCPCCQMCSLVEELLCKDCKERTPTCGCASCDDGHHGRLEKCFRMTMEGLKK